MEPVQPTKDSQDQQFGVSAARDEEVVDGLVADGIEEKDLPDESGDHPRAGGKAPPEGDCQP